MFDLFKKPASSTALHAYRCHHGKIEKLEPEAVNPTINLSSDILQQPGYLEVEGLVFDARQDGLYRFYKLGTYSEQRIVCQNGLSSLLKIVGYLWSYGNRDDLVQQPVLRQMLCSRTVVGACGTLSWLVIGLCQSLGINARLVATMTTEVWNGQDDGHTLVEIQGSDGDWSTYDPSFHRLFKSGIREVCNGHHSADILPGNTGNGGFVTKNYDYGFWVDERLLSASFLSDWYKRVFDVPLIYNGQNFCYPASKVPESSKTRFKERYISLSDGNFNDLFYKDVTA